jgi:MFS superfamily sulfate permease-like transporter
VAQGVGNVVSGAIGGLPVTSVIVRSGANVAAGGRERLSAVVHGVLLVITVLFAADLLTRIPLAALAAVLIHVGANLCAPALFSTQARLGWTQFAPFALTIVAVLALDLLKGVVAGIGVGVLFVLYQNSRGAVQQERSPSGQLVLRFHRDGTFLSKPSLVAMLDAIPDGERVLIDATGEYLDHDVKETLATFLADAPRRSILVTVTGVDLSMATVGGGH